MLSRFESLNYEEQIQMYRLSNDTLLRQQIRLRWNAIREQWTSENEDSRSYSLAQLKVFLESERVETKTKADDVRDQALLRLLKLTEYTEKENTAELYARYLEFRKVDQCRQELHAVVRLRTQPRVESAYSQLDSTIRSANSSTMTMYSQLSQMRDIKELPKYSDRVKHTIDYLKTKVTAVQTRLKMFTDKKNAIFTPKFQFSKTYEHLKTREDLISGIAEFFDDYAEASFHWGRHHRKLASAMAKKIRTFEEKRDYKNLQDYLCNMLHGVAANVDIILNISGTFSKRIHFCLSLLEERMKIEDQVNADQAYIRAFTENAVRYLTPRRYTSHGA
jgi:hypothetical protein